ncbi:MAG: DUF3047 domain-containing protein [Deltaproteobacteria bacterium]
MRQSMLLLAMLAAMSIPSAALSPDTIEVGRFSAETAEGGLPSGWSPFTFKNSPKHTHYGLVKEGGVMVVMATSQGAVSALSREIKIDPKEYPIIRWRWKIANTLRGSDLKSKKGDDYSARIYITFQYDPSKSSALERAKYKAARLAYGKFPPLGAINYIWTKNSPDGAFASNPHLKQSKMFVAESGDAKVGEWVFEQRDVYEDFKRAFGREPTAISAVAIMTDTDNTGEAAVAYYGDIEFLKAGK